MISTAIALLGALANLLTILVQNPGISEDIKQRAIELSTNAIAIASQVVEQETLARRDEREFRIHPKPTYDLYSLERTIHMFINNERARLALRPLEWHEDIARVARRHSEDQADTNRRTTSIHKPCSYPFIRHEGLTPAGFDLAERLDFGRIPFRRAGENIVMLSSVKDAIYRAPSPITCPTASRQQIPENATPEKARSIILYNIEAAEIALGKVPEVQWVNKSWTDIDSIAHRAVAGWIESPGHYANIANERFSRTGIGATVIGRHIIVTQVFTELL